MKTSMVFVLALAAGLLFCAAGHAQAPADGASTADPAAASAGVEPAAPASGPAAAPPPAAPPKKRISGKKLALIIAGWTVFGTTWLPAVGWGAYSATLYAPSAVFVIPCLGPIIVGILNFTASSIWGNSGGNSEVSGIMIGLGVFFVFWGLIQGAGLAMAIAGHVIRDEPAQASLKKMFGKQRRAGVTLAPLATKESVGLGLAGWF